MHAAGERLYLTDSPNSPEVEGACRHVQFMTKILSCEKNSCRIFSKTRNGITNVKLNGLSYLVCQHCRRLSLSLSLKVNLARPAVNLSLSAFSQLEQIIIQPDDPNKIMYNVLFVLIVIDTNSPW